MSLAFCSTLDELYRNGGAIDAGGVQRHASGLSTPNNLFLLRSLMMSLKPERTIEVGLAAGGSALTFGASHRDLNQAPTRQHVAIDPYQNVWHHLGKTLLARADLEEFSRVIEEPSCLALPDLMRAGERFQLAYIDGSHAFHEALLDFYYVRHLLTVGGVVLFDDCATPDIRRLMSFIRKHIVSFKEFDLEPFRLDRSAIGRSRYRLAKFLGRTQCLAFQKVADPKKDESWQWD